jgi:hypothetical protein
MSDCDRSTDEHPGPPSARHHAAASDLQYPFTESEMARLLVFRAAIDAGFYSDSLAAVWHRR